MQLGHLGWLLQKHLRTYFRNGRGIVQLTGHSSSDQEQAISTVFSASKSLPSYSAKVEEIQERLTTTSACQKELLREIDERAKGAMNVHDYKNCTININLNM